MEPTVPDRKGEQVFIVTGDVTFPVNLMRLTGTMTVLVLTAVAQESAPLALAAPPTGKKTNDPWYNTHRPKKRKK